MLNGPLLGLVQMSVTVWALWRRLGNADDRVRGRGGRPCITAFRNPMATFSADALERKGAGAVQTA
jgi:hypothetical protein